LAWPFVLPFAPSDQTFEVAWVESDRAAQVNGGELAALDQTLHGSRMDVKTLRGLRSGQKFGSGTRLVIVWSAVALCRVLSCPGHYERLWPWSRVIEEGELINLNRHPSSVTYQ
jgi:hypothetical protein